MNKKTALITGSSRGIGRAIAILFARNNYNVVINYNKSEKEAQELYDMLRKENLSIRIFKADVSNVQEANALVNYTIGQFENIDVLVNNAGITKDGLLLRMKDEDFNSVLDVNLKGTFNTTKSISPIMIKQKHGKIINISSVVGIVGNAGQCNYAASKAGVIGFSKSVARELASRNINVNVVAPGYIDTDMTKSLPDKVKDEILKSIPMKKMGNPKEVANLVLFLSSSLSDYITGQVINVDGGMVMA